MFNLTWRRNSECHLVRDGDGAPVCGKVLLSAGGDRLQFHHHRPLQRLLYLQSGTVQHVETVEQNNNSILEFTNIDTFQTFQINKNSQ